MKIKHLFGLAVIAAMTASCSSNEDLGTAGPGTGTNESGVGYASFTINLPSVSGSTTSGARGTRAAGDFEFNAGDAKEYDVNDATLLIFKEAGASENEYTFVESVNLGSMAPWKDPSEPGVTTHAKITAKLNKVNTKDKFYALVLLNNGTESSKKVDLPADNQPFSEWNEAKANVTDKIANTANGFYMANAPLYKDNKVTTLVPIESSKIYPTEAQAASNPSTDIYVERGLAKVTVTSASKDTKTIADGTYKDDKVTIQNWGLDVTNKKSFPVHKTDGTGYDNIWSNTATPEGTANHATTLRFVDNNTTTVAKRVYWGVDPNYDIAELYAETTEGKKARTDNFNYVGKDELTATTSDAQYCLENTFNLDNMMQGQTTRVVFKAKYEPKGFTPGATFYMVGKNTAIWTEKNLKDEIVAAVTKVVASATSTNTTVDLTAAAGGADITKAGNHLLALGNISVTGVTLQQTDIDAINAKLGLKKGEGISTYQDAEAYYIARVKHFGVLTPWNAGQSYGTDNLSFLGRYGVLRNNWYELEVNKVSGPGYPDVPEVKPNVPDDENFKYISVSVKILSWAKRSDTVDL